MITLPNGRKIGDGQPVFIVAEIGSNWRDFDDCLISIAQAKACGADAVKFQAYNEMALYGVMSLTDATDPSTCTLSVEELEARGSLRKALPGQLPLEWLPKLKAKADACGIAFMCSAFSPKLIDAVDPFVNIHKVASAECTHVRMLERLRAIGKPVILSTGAHGLADIRQSLHVLADFGTDPGHAHANPPVPVVLLYCVAAYPARLIDFPQMLRLRDAFRMPVGFSDHSTDALVIPKAAVDAGACVVEKHVSFIDAETPDSPHSLRPHEFKAMVTRLRQLPNAGIYSEEKEMVLRHNRRLIAVKPIRSGDMLVEGENFDICRSLKDDTSALGPFSAKWITGREAKRDIQAGDGIGPSDV